MTLVYVSHPIKGKSEAELVDIEARALKWCMHRDFQALLPRTLKPGCLYTTRRCVPDGSAGQDQEHTHACYMRGDIMVLSLNADVILMMPGWELSVGARAELNVALVCGVRVEVYNTIAEDAATKRGHI